ncbi:MAG: hypothetical protein ACTSUI_00600 [Promethearchaeota archaeon]
MSKKQKQLKNQFQVKISSCGTNMVNGGFSIIKDTNAIELIEKANIQMAKCFVGNNNTEIASFLFTLGLDLLKNTSNKFNEIPDSDKLSDLIECFEIAQPKDLKKREELNGKND